MEIHEKVKRRGRPATAERWQRSFEVAAIAVVLVTVVSLSACLTSKEAFDGSRRGNYFKDPNSVWKAIELSLIDLDYAITEKNRPDGVIQAESNRADDGTVIVLDIDQVVRTDDQVSVYVKPSFGDGGGSTNPDLLKAAADEFMKILDTKVNG